MIDRLDANNKVGRIWVGFGGRDEWSFELLEIVIDKYCNAYDFRIWDHGGLVDDMIHGLAK